MRPSNGADLFRDAGAPASRIVPDPRSALGDEPESLEVWGFRGAGFDFLPNGSVILKGDRYAGSGVELPDLLPWVRRTIACDIQPGDIHRPHYPPEIPEPRLPVADPTERSKPPGRVVAPGTSKSNCEKSRPFRGICVV